MYLNNPERSLKKKALFFSLPIALILILKLFDFDGLYGQDAYEYLRYSKAITNYFTGSNHPGLFYWPVLYPFLGSLLGFITGNILALQLISCFSLSLTCWFSLKTLKLLYPDSKHLFNYVLVFGLCAPFVLKMGLVVMSDALSLASISLSFYYFFKSYYANSSTTLIFVFATCALMSRYASIVITLPIITYALILIFKRKKFTQLLKAIAISLLVCMPFILFQWGALFEASSNYFLNTWSFINYFKSSFNTQDGTTFYKLPNIVFAFNVFFHPGFIFLGILLAAFLIKTKKYVLNFHQIMLLSCSLLYIFFLAGIPFQNQRILALTFPLILVFFYPAFIEVSNINLVKPHLIWLFILAVIIQVSLFSLTFKSIFNRSVIEKQLVSLVRPYQGAVLYSFDVDIALQGRELDFDYKNMFTRRYTNFKKEDLILFHPKRYKLQWKDKNPMLNWNYVVKNHTLKKLETHKDGWCLYQIQ